MNTKGILINGAVYTAIMFLLFQFVISKDRGLGHNVVSTLLAGTLYTVSMLLYNNYRNKKNNKPA